MLRLKHAGCGQEDRRIGTIAISLYLSEWTSITLRRPKFSGALASPGTRPRPNLIVASSQSTINQSPYLLFVSSDFCSER